MGENRLRVLEYRLLRMIFKPNWEVVTGGWRKLHSEELFIFLYIIRVIKSRHACGTYKEEETFIQGFVR